MANLKCVQSFFEPFILIFYSWFSSIDKKNLRRALFLYVMQSVLLQQEGRGIKEKQSDRWSFDTELKLSAFLSVNPPSCLVEILAMQGLALESLMFGAVALINLAGSRDRKLVSYHSAIISLNLY